MDLFFKMIVEAFSHYLKKQFAVLSPDDSNHKSYGETRVNTRDILHRWLDEHLNNKFTHNLHTKSGKENAIAVGNVIREEITIAQFEDELWYIGTSDSGERLLKTLYHYCDSYDRWQFSRWLHQVQPSQFTTTSP